VFNFEAGTLLLKTTEMQAGGSPRHPPGGRNQPAETGSRGDSAENGEEPSSLAQNLDVVGNRRAGFQRIPARRAQVGSRTMLIDRGNRA
jgi:hypothetical protein